MIKQLTLILAVLFIAQSAIRADIMPRVPGYGDQFQTQVYAGYLNTTSPLRRMHYVFVESVKLVNNSDPVTLWLNGGPGCSSLFGFIQQIGPYFLEDGKHYKVGDKLTPNPYSWHKLSNLLFLQSPAGVGYSTNKDANYQHNDMNTANDNFAALLNFFQNFPQYSKNPFWIAGQSYAGKYIPDLAVRIDAHNRKDGVTKINLLGFMIGNGVISFQNGQLDKSGIEFMINHDFIDPELVSYYNRACLTDPKSAGCQYFNARYAQNVEEINPYNVYDYCFYNDSFIAQGEEKRKFHSQGSILKNIARNGKFQQEKDFNGAPCMYFDGMFEYFNAHVKEYHGEDGMTWEGPCNHKLSANYTIDQSGSTYQMIQLLGDIGKYHIVLYNGDWDDVVPYTDTIKNLQKLKLEQTYLYTPWIVNDQHAGFIQLYSGVSFVLVKGASHQVPQSKRAEAFDLFETVVKSQGSQEEFKKKIFKLQN